MTEEERFTEDMKYDNTFWAHLYREKGAKTHEEARAIAEEFHREARSDKDFLRVRVR